MREWTGRMRFFYTILFYLALPFVLVRVWLKSRRLPAYRQRVPERLGFYPFQLNRSIWVHAVSVGESIAAFPLIKLLKSHYPNYAILVTTMTPTGAERIKAMFGETVNHVYLPYDLPGAMERFYEAMNPCIGIIMETELWPNLLAKAVEKSIPICLVNARLSEKSARGYARISNLTKKMLNQFAFIAATGRADADRFLSLGAEVSKVVVTGNIKFDLEIPTNIIDAGIALRKQLGGQERFVWIAASTHENEEEQVLSVHQALCKVDPNALLILVPRHPDRFAKVHALCEQHFSTVKRSETNTAQDLSQTAVYLGDTMGELMLLYYAADVAFVGGSLIPRGGHNVLEPGALGKPILSGPHVFNFAEITHLFSQANALTIVKDANMLTEQLLQLHKNLNQRQQVGVNAKQLVDSNRGALNRQFQLVSGIMQ